MAAAAILSRSSALIIRLAMRGDCVLGDGGRFDRRHVFRRDHF